MAMSERQLQRKIKVILGTTPKGGFMAKGKCPDCGREIRFLRFGAYGGVPRLDVWQEGMGREA